MIRVLVPRPAADALLPRVCEKCGGKRGKWEHDGPHDRWDDCPTCDGSGSLPPLLTWLVVEGKRVSRRFGIPLPTDSTEGVLVPSAGLVRAIESGERIGIEVCCETCDPHTPGYVTALTTFRCPGHCTEGRVLVGSVRPTEVLPIVQEPPSGPRRDAVTIGLDYRAWHFNRPIDLSLYGDPGSLVGRYAIACEDARREG